MRNFINTEVFFVFPDRLKKLRQDRKLTQDEFGHHMNVTKSTVSRWEAGTIKPPYNKIVEIADFFGVSVEYLLGESEKTTKKEPVDLMEVLRDRELPHIDGVPIDEETAKILYYQLKAFKEKLLAEMEEKKKRD
ncbi:helix-turn-helix transcriptional regulator [Thermoactinomyces sp. CICC 24226]|uniref:helix-turn-helix domain-containing protein n=1 Tax=Thermoactinomyces sp. CICC 24226 TaxID=2767431 RepID=UPI0018DE68AA|nr:helix-turn-helix transcriptional regulator [Thermoactinomyces sp. CICC 24226]MBI0392545.1 helix-turn-helix transcriptional regulator [Thermoactinomyces sp. CICC 24226]